MTICYRVTNCLECPRERCKFDRGTRRGHEDPTNLQIQRRERQVAMYLLSSTGASNADIALRFGVSSRTVRNALLVCRRLKIESSVSSSSSVSV